MTADAHDPSMAEILASIQRILSENEPDEPASSNEHASHADEADDDNVLVLEKSMMVSDGAALATEPPHKAIAEAPYKSPLLEAATSKEPAPRPTAVPTPHPFPMSEEPAAVKAAAQPPVTMPAPTEAAPAGRGPEVGLVASSAAAIAASSIGNLVRTLTAERVVPVQRGGLTIEDLVREELRPLLKGWLDTHLPPLVEKLVQVEIERVVNRATS